MIYYDLNANYKKFIIKLMSNSLTADDLEENLNKYYFEWIETPLDDIKTTPLKYVSALGSNLINAVKEQIDLNKIIPDIYIDEILSSSRVDVLHDLITSKNDAYISCAIDLYISLDTGTEFLLDHVTSKTLETEAINECYDFLSSNVSVVADTMIERFYNLDYCDRKIYAEILSNLADDERVFKILVGMLAEQEDISLFAILLGRYQDSRAIPYLRDLLSLTNDKEELKELNAAIERLL